LEQEKVRALSNFYREEFQRHLDYLESSGVGGEKPSVERVCRRFLKDLDSVCWRSDFPALAETLLRNFDALTRLSEHDPQRGH